MIQKKERKQICNLLILMILFYSCGTHKELEPVRVNLKRFSVSFDSNYQQPFIAEDSFGHRGVMLLTNWKDTIYFNFGYGDVCNLAEKDPTVIFAYDIDSLKAHIDTQFIDTSDVIFTNKVNFDIDEFRKQDVHFHKISGFKAKITVPRENTKGAVTGVYFDSLRKDAGGRLKFNFYSSNLDSLRNNQLLKAMKTIKFNLE